MQRNGAPAAFAVAVGPGYTGPWGKYSDARMLLDAWRRVLDQEEPDYAM